MAVAKWMPEAACIHRTNTILREDYLIQYRDSVAPLFAQQIDYPRGDVQEQRVCQPEAVK